MLDMPDIARSTKPTHSGSLNWVGMSKVALPISIEDGHASQQVNAWVQIFVNLHNPHVKGIHMSRLYLLLTQYAASGNLSVSSLRDFLSHLLESHEEISNAAKISFEFEYPINQPALKSQYSGWKAYPAGIIATYEKGETALELHCAIPYSSTCPCSASLARQLLEQKFHSDFANSEIIARSEVEAWLKAETGSYATPHSQRSLAKIFVKLASVNRRERSENSRERSENSTQYFPIRGLVKEIEQALQTPVQTAVKREDEQEFARLNGQNLMFCEDAARRIKNALQNNEDYTDFWVRVEHYESLHAHDAVSIVTKGIMGGYEALMDRYL